MEQFLNDINEKAAYTLILRLRLSKPIHSQRISEFKAKLGETIIAAIIAQASAKGALFAVLAFPISVPILISGINGIRLAMDGEQFSGCLADLQILFSFSIVIITLSLLLFEFIWRK